MDTKYNIKTRGADGKYLTLGNVTPGEKGPRMGLRVTPELRQMVAGKADGEWLNFLLFADDGQRQAAQPAPRPRPASDEPIPF